MFTYFFDHVNGYLQIAKALSKADKLKINKIVSYAIIATDTHMGRYGTDEFDRSSQMLSAMWLDASNELMKFNNVELERFAKVLKEKSYFWANPHAFDYSNPHAFDMMLNQVKTKLKELTA